VAQLLQPPRPLEPEVLTVATEHRLPLWAEDQEALQARVRGRARGAPPAPEEVEQGQEVDRAFSPHITSPLPLHERADLETVGVRHRVTVAAKGEVGEESHMPHRHHSRHQVTVRRQVVGRVAAAVLAVRAVGVDELGAAVGEAVVAVAVQEADARIQYEIFQ
jgi:hypothetical protein